MLLAGLFLVGAAVGLLPVDDSTFNAPRWLVAMVGALIAAAGAYVIALPVTTPAQRAALGGAIALGFFTVMGACFTWVLLANATGRGTLSVWGLPVPLPEVAERWLNRVMVGLFALLMDGLALFGWWRLLTGRWRPLVHGRPAS
jgi:hypothetical protein